MTETDRRLSEESEQRFLDLYAHLLVYVNDRFEVIGEIETVADLEQHYTDELLPLRNTLYNESTTDLIEDFVEENLPTCRRLISNRSQRGLILSPESSSSSAIERTMRSSSIGQNHRKHMQSARLDFRSPKCGTSPHFQSQFRVSSYCRSRTRSSTTGGSGSRTSFSGVLSTDIGDEYEEAKHRFGIIDSLPVPEEDEKTDAEELRFYMKNKRNRERYASEIEQLREKTNELERIYHQEMGKARARSLGRELRELELNEAYVAIYDDRIITSAPSESEVRKLLEEIMPAGKTDHPYIYHFDP